MSTDNQPSAAAVRAEAQMIVNVLEVARTNIWPDERMTDDVDLVAYVDRIKEKYSAYKRHHDFSTSARLAQVEIVEEIIDAAIREATAEKAGGAKWSDYAASDRGRLEYALQDNGLLKAEIAEKDAQIARLREALESTPCACVGSGEFSMECSRCAALASIPADQPDAR